MLHTLSATEYYVLQLYRFATYVTFNVIDDETNMTILEQMYNDGQITNEAMQLLIDDEALHTVITKYTREAGVRGLKKQLRSLKSMASC